MRQNESGFTMVELLVGLAIISVLTAIAVPIYLSQRAKAAESAVKTEVEQAAVQWQRDYYANMKVWNVAFLNELNVPGASTVLTGVVGSNKRACVEGVSKRDAKKVYSFALAAGKGAKTSCGSNPHM